MTPEDETYTAIAAVIVGVVLSAWVGWWLVVPFGVDAPDTNPLVMVISLVSGRSQWPTSATIPAVGFASAVLTAVVVVLRRRNDPARRFDRAARALRSAGLRRYTNGTGPRIGKRIGGGWVGMTNEDTATVIAGPRTGKTTSIVIPAAVEANGPLLVTSNKRDIVDHLAGARPGPVWIFDPQQLAGHTSSSWWWNPLTMATTVAGARRLSGIWTKASADPDAKADEYFTPAAQELLTNLLLAAATGNRPLTDIWAWLGDPGNTTPNRILDQHPDFHRAASSLASSQSKPDKQREGIYGGVAKTMAWLSDPNLEAWYTETSNRPRFQPESFVASNNDTILLLSKEGPESAAPLVTALTAAIVLAAEGHAAQQPTGRLNPELTVILDEAANVCRWDQLPDLYSHFGSRGIILMSIFQSWAQLEAGWGRQGAAKLWGASNCRVYLGGVSDTTFLRSLADLCGQQDNWTRSTSRGRGGRQISTSTRRLDILSVAQLAAIPQQRSLALFSGAGPVVLRMIPWWHTKHKTVITESINQHRNRTPLPTTATDPTTEMPTPAFPESRPL